MYINRILEKELLKYINKREILAVIGSRQCGKTTLLKHIFSSLKDAVFLDFGDRQTLELFTEDTDSFISLYVKKYRYVFIDEFQYAKDGGKILKYIYDSSKTKLIISGSSATELSIQSIKHLVGRIFVFNLHPLSFEEYISYKNPDLLKVMRTEISSALAKKIMPFFHDFCIYGGYPRVVLADDNEEKEVILRNIYSTYFLKEIKETLNLPSDYKLSRLLNALSLQIGNMINYNELSSLTGFRHPELLSYLNILEKTFICIRSRPYYTNKRTELVKSPKIFFYDNGFRNIVLKNFQPLENRQDKGSLYENFAATELAKKQLEIRYWRTKSKAEIDFIVEKNGRIIPIEIKSAIPKITKSMLSFIEHYRPKKAIVLSEHSSSKKSIKNTHVISAPVFAVSNML